MSRWYFYKLLCPAFNFSLLHHTCRPFAAGYDTEVVILCDSSLCVTFMHPISTARERSCALSGCGLLELCLLEETPRPLHTACVGQTAELLATTRGSITSQTNKLDSIFFFLFIYLVCSHFVVWLKIKSNEALLKPPIITLQQILQCMLWMNEQCLHLTQTEPCKNWVLEQQKVNCMS